MKRNLDNSNIRKILLIFFIPFLLMGFKGIEYKTIKKTIKGVDYQFQIPSTFCEYNDYETKKGIIQFLKCHEIELMNEKQPVFFSERIYIIYDENENDIQNTTDKFFAKVRKDIYNKMPKEEKDAYLYNPLYPENNKQKASVINDIFIFEKTGKNKNGDKYKIYEASLFLNKRFFVINWVQILTKYEDFIKTRTFTDFIKENKTVNDKKTEFYYHSEDEFVIIREPNFGHFKYYTDIEQYNPNNSNGVFLKLATSLTDNYVQLFELSMLKGSISTQEVYKKFLNSGQNQLDLKLIKYKDTDFITLEKDDFTTYSCYINFSPNITGFLVYRTPNEVGFKKAISDIYRYRNQLIEDNKLLKN